MKKLLLILLFSTSLFSQQTSQSGYWTAVMGDSIGANRTSQSKAQADATLLLLAFPDSTVTIKPPNFWRVSLEYEPKHIIDSFFVDVPYAVHDTTFIDVPYAVHDTVIEVIDRPIQIDTITKRGFTVYRDYSSSMTQPTTSPLTYAMLHDIGVVEIFADTIYSWQRLFVLERAKYYGQTFYRNLEIPFHVTNVLISDITATSVTIHLWFNDDNVTEVYAEYKEVGTTEIFTTSKGLENIVSPDLLKPGTEYEFKVLAKDSNNKNAISETYYFKTL